MASRGSETSVDSDITHEVSQVYGEEGDVDLGEMW